MKIETLAGMVHEANRVYCHSIEQYDKEPWDMTPKIIQYSIEQGIKFLAANPDQTPEQMHENWFQYKLDEGWTYGTEVDVAEKKHNCMMPYAELPENEKLKDRIFHAIVHEFLDDLEWDEEGGVTIEGSSSDAETEGGKHIHAEGAVFTQAEVNS